MTHNDMSEEDLDRCGISDSMVRLSVGLESSDDLIEDLMAALKVVDNDFAEGANLFMTGASQRGVLKLYKNGQDADLRKR